MHEKITGHSDSIIASFAKHICTPVFDRNITAVGGSLINTETFTGNIDEEQ